MTRKRGQVSRRLFKRALVSDPAGSPTGIEAAWRWRYTEERMHSTIGDVTPREFIHTYQEMARLTQEITSSPLV